MLLFVKRIVGVNETDAAEYRQRGADQHLICRSRGNRLPPQIGGFGKWSSWRSTRTDWSLVNAFLFQQSLEFSILIHETSKENDVLHGPAPDACQPRLP